jgi:ABC-2 type transport system ATP-binding protein
MTSHAVEVRELSKTYPGGVEALRGIDFEVSPGEVFGLLGPNGAGKSTAVGILTGTIAPTSGRALVAGFDVNSDRIAARQASAVVFQENVLDRSLSGRRNLRVHARLWSLDGSGANDRIDAVVDTFGLGEMIDRPVETYSGGQRRRLEIARALVSEPRVLFLDEPTVGLDPRIRQELLDLLAGLRARSGMSTVLTTHYLDEAEQQCDRVAIIHEGRIVALDRPAALLAGLGNELVEFRIDGDLSRAVSSLRAHAIVGDDTFAVGSTLYVPMHDRPRSHVISGISHLGLVITATTSRPPTLDDVYLQLTGVSLVRAA